ncbi:MAG: HAD hydrolase-like protein [candidate division WOR-3 bacterium]|nr:MAG: HAD hydrolase-like protein [candidate division WOR-3 bacterium]
MVKHYTTYLFDLDGTLTDSKPGITNSILYALSKLGIEEENKTSLDKFIGPPLLDSFMKYYGLDESRAREAVAQYREYYGTRGIYESKLCGGISDLLAILDAKGCRLILATSKASIYALRILEHFSIDGYFDSVFGSNFDLTRASKTEILADILEEISPYSKDFCLMIGDHRDDVTGARENGIDSVAVTYGYGSEQELAELDPTYMVHCVGELSNLLLRSTWQ